MTLLQTKRSKVSPIGIDPGELGVRVVQLLREGERYTVRSVVAGPWLDGDDRTGTSERLPAQLRDQMGGTSFCGRRAVVALSDSSVDYFALDLPSAVLANATSNVSEVVQWEVARLMKTGSQPMETGHWYLPATKLSAPNAMAVSVGRERVCRIVDACRKAGLHCETVDAAAAALSRFGVWLRRPSPDLIWGMLDIGATRTTLVVCLDEVPVLVRRAGTGGRCWTDRIAEALPVSRQAAELHKCEHGIVRVRGASVPEQEVSKRNEVGAIVLGAIRPDLHDIAAEVKRSYEYVLSCYPGRRVGDLMLVGGGACMRNLPDFLGDALGIEVRVASQYLPDAGCRLTFSSGKRHRIEQTALAIGAALGA